jgi:hypothetical protein
MVLNVLSNEKIKKYIAINKDQGFLKGQQV